MEKENWKNLSEYYRFTKRDEKAYPVVSRILKKLTPERIKKEVEAIQKIKLPSDLQKWVREYEKVGERDEFTWKCFLKAKEGINYYISVPGIYEESLQEVNFLMAMFVILLDDIDDVSQNKNLLNELLKIPLGKNYIKTDKLNQEEKEYLEFTSKVWQRIEELIKKFPKYNEFEDVFRYDIEQIINALKYEYLLNRNHYLINKTEYWLYSPHTMQIITGTIIDLMFLPAFGTFELSKIREITWRAKKMARIGNCLSTWEKEMCNNDFSSGIFSFAINSKIFIPQELVNINNSKIIKKIKEAKIENVLLKKWESFYKEINNFKKEIKIINIQKLLRGLEGLLIIELVRKRHTS